MAYYAFLDENNVVTEVIPGVDENELIEGKKPEVWYGEFRGQVCKRTSYNTHRNVHTEGKTPFRGNYAGIGHTYDSEFDIFIPPQPFPSWKLNYETVSWESPVPKPAPGPDYIWKWSEVNKEWIKVQLEV